MTSALETELAATQASLAAVRNELATTTARSQDDLRGITEKHEAALQSALEAASRQLSETTSEMQRKHSDAMKQLRVELEAEVSAWKAKFERASSDFEVVSCFHVPVGAQRPYACLVCFSACQRN
jgi:hypothetical protein